ncbi:hypothetical protein [Cupriavidus consociatus]|uniref:hypothetical protein n=1 Tax=Cupriavidus consociatus TaxID=2821357 RepID=UPI001AE56AC2|nr:MULTISPECIES: hypothetical protein [unclassified Cupriavidus]MBP0624939.1 hypothetical protein [Cupriavidus sp. LEh25]MDK2661671.1 hypothetical protein [Cupriavidus sp. LEh21]
MRRDVIYVIAGSAIPAIGNFLAVVIALKNLNVEWAGKCYALMAMFFVAIDVFNFGAARIYSVSKIRESFPSLLFLDFFSALGSSVIFLGGVYLLHSVEVVAMPQIWLILVLAPMAYAMSHFALGYLRLNGGNGLICLVAAFAASLRVAAVWKISLEQQWEPYFPDLLLAVEAIYGLLLLGAYRIVVAKRLGNTATSQSLRLANYSQIVKFAWRELLSSWYSNALFSGAKHVDVMIVAAAAGPAAAGLYRGVKSIQNLAFNFGQSLAYIVQKRFDYSSILRNKERKSVVLFVFAAMSILGCGLMAYLSCVVNLFPLGEVGPFRQQFYFMFLVFGGALLIFSCRLISLYVFVNNSRRFVFISTFEVIGVIVALLVFTKWLGVFGAVVSMAVVYAVLVPLSILCLPKLAET